MGDDIPTIEYETKSSWTMLYLCDDMSPCREMDNLMVFEAFSMHTFASLYALFYSTPLFSILSKSITSSSTSVSGTCFPFPFFPPFFPFFALVFPLLPSLILPSSSSSSPNKNPLPFMRLFSSDEKVECAVPEAKFDDAESSPSIHEKLDDVRCGRERGERLEVGCNWAGLAIDCGVEGRGVRAGDVEVDAVTGACIEGGLMEIGGALDVRSGGTGDGGAGSARVSAAFTLAACSVGSSGSGMEASSR
jgi:hypothetical protein